MRVRIEQSVSPLKDTSETEQGATSMTKEERRKVEEPKFRPEEIAEILGIDRKGVMRLTNKLLMGYYQLGPRTRRIGQRHLEAYLTRTRAKTRKMSKKRRAELTGILDK
jgi:excisionase family DNA binding protein